MRSPEGWTWHQPAQAPGPGWYWWDESMNCLDLVDIHDLYQLPLKLVQKVDSQKGALGRQSVPLRLAEMVVEGDWVKAWWDGQVAWAVTPSSGPTPKRQHETVAAGRPALQTVTVPRPIDGAAIGQAVERGGGSYIRAVPERNGWRVHWNRSGVNYATLVDAHLNVVTAGFCLSGGDRAQDLTSLVSLVEGRESLNADPRVWRGDPGW
ncbi:hypothetical protein IV102_00305 [bacterium]|nr:hypothetical protein [bacterium]